MDSIINLRMAKTKTELALTGITGHGLVSKAEEVLSAAQGVEYAHVNLGAAKASVNFDDSVTSAEALIAVLAGAGFEASKT